MSWESSFGFSEIKNVINDAIGWYNGCTGSDTEDTKRCSEASCLSKAENVVLLDQALQDDKLQLAHFKFSEISSLAAVKEAIKVNPEPSVYTGSLQSLFANNPSLSLAVENSQKMEANSKLQSMKARERLVCCQEEQDSFYKHAKTMLIGAGMMVAGAGVAIFVPVPHAISAGIGLGVVGTGTFCYGIIDAIKQSEASLSDVIIPECEDEAKAYEDILIGREAVGEVEDGVQGQDI